MFSAAMVILGLSNSFVGYYRFAAADGVDEGFLSQAISWVIAGGIVAAVLGPWLATGAKGWSVQWAIRHGGVDSGDMAAA